MRGKGWNEEFAKCRYFWFENTGCDFLMYFHPVSCITDPIFCGFFPVFSFSETFIFCLNFSLLSLCLFLKDFSLIGKLGYSNKSVLSVLNIRIKKRGLSLLKLSTMVTKKTVFSCTRCLQFNFLLTASIWVLILECDIYFYGIRAIWNCCIMSFVSSLKNLFAQ